MRRLTGTHVYSYVKCPHLAALDLHLPRSERRAPAEHEEFAAARGRQFEADYVRGLGVVAPAYPERDFDAGAVATQALLRAGVPLVHQAVLAADDRLGLPDLLRRIDGASAFGDFHYEVLDVKTSGRARGDQVLQVTFYALLLAELQGRLPEHGYVITKSGTEERFAIADYTAAVHEVLAELRRLRDDLGASRPFLLPACSGCYHDRRCFAQLEAEGDLSLVQGMSHGARAILESLGCRSVRDLAVFHPEGARARGNLDPTLVRRLRRAAHANLLGKPLVEERPRVERLEPAALVGVLTDPYAGRLLAVGTLSPAREDGAFVCEVVPAPDDEWRAVKRVCDGLTAATKLLHFGDALPRWYAEHAFAREADPALEVRFVDLRPRLRGAAVWPRPTFELADYVRQALGRDPHRAGHAGAAALWATGPDAAPRLAAKLHQDLCDLAVLKEQVLDAAPSPAQEPAPGAIASATAENPLPAPTAGPRSG